MNAYQALLALSLAVPGGGPQNVTIPEPSEAFLSVNAGTAESPWRLEVQRERLYASSRDAGETFRFGVIGDIEPGKRKIQQILFPPADDAFDRLVTDLQTKDPDLILQLGDMVSVGTSENFAAFTAKLDALVQVPFFPVIGNHDRDDPHNVVPHTQYQKVFGPGDFWFERGGYRFVMLDTSDGRVMPEQLAWFEEALNTTDKRTVVSIHIPPVYLNKQLDGPERLPRRMTASARGVEIIEKDKFFRTWFERGSEEFRRIVEQAGVERVYIGHLHTLASTQINNVRYVVSGGGGSPLYRFPGIPGDKITHYILATATPQGVSEEVFNLSTRRRERVLRFEANVLEPVYSVE